MKQTIMVTGASGYIASWIVKYLLEDGHTVHATVRKLTDKTKINHLEKLGADFEGKLKLFEADLTAQGSFHEAAKECSIILHTASPFFIAGIKNAQEQLIKPALEGTLNVLQAANDTEGVKRVVLTSSVAAIMGDNTDIPLNGKAFTEADWNKSSSPTHSPYSYSKMIAEREAWKMAKSQSRWTLTTINPGFVMGPSLSKRVDSTSFGTLIDVASGKFETGAPDLHFGMVDVRDVARAHVLAALNPSVSGRHICMADVYNFLDVASLLKKNFGNNYPFPKKKLPKFLFYLIGPFLGFSWKYTRNNVGVPIRFDNSYIQKDLDITFRPFEQTLIDHFNQLLEAGLITKK